MTKAKRKRHSFYESNIPEVEEWIDAQHDLGLSLSLIISDARAMYGSGDVIRSNLSFRSQQVPHWIPEARPGQVQGATYPPPHYPPHSVMPQAQNQGQHTQLPHGMQNAPSLPVSPPAEPQQAPPPVYSPPPQMPPVPQTQAPQPPVSPVPPVSGESQPQAPATVNPGFGLGQDPATFGFAGISNSTGSADDSTSSADEYLNSLIKDSQ